VYTGRVGARRGVYRACSTCGGEERCIQGV
jgi:hypothetical protein